ncbi:hypothetical protein [Paenibacillus sp.]|uniref:hypothetical protein n=1 Tax=Paenibacillus sp. TaxID=58172 RepID=UPI0028381B44|nr:hypothetical protein [Paenibacillus sp.]MDR0269250.1 hypothetical protein [Paenibacillus sp.]
MINANSKLISLFQQLEEIKETYISLSSSSLHKNSGMQWTVYKNEYEKIGEIMSSGTYKQIQAEFIEEVMYSIFEMLDGYKGLEFDADIIDKQTGESIIQGIQLHDKYRDFIEANRDM